MSGKLCEEWVRRSNIGELLSQDSREGGWQEKGELNLMGIRQKIMGPEERAPSYVRPQIKGRLPRRPLREMGSDSQRPGAGQGCGQSGASLPPADLQAEVWSPDCGYSHRPRQQVPQRRMRGQSQRGLGNGAQN